MCSPAVIRRLSTPSFCIASTKPKPSISTPMEPHHAGSARVDGVRGGRDVVAAGYRHVGNHRVQRRVRVHRPQADDLVVDVARLDRGAARAVDAHDDAGGVGVLERGLERGDDAIGARVPLVADDPTDFRPVRCCRPAVFGVETTGDRPRGRRWSRRTRATRAAAPGFQRRARRFSASDSRAKRSSRSACPGPVARRRGRVRQGSRRIRRVGRASNLVNSALPMKPVLPAMAEEEPADLPTKAPMDVRFKWRHAKGGRFQAPAESDSVRRRNRRPRRAPRAPHLRTALTFDGTANET